MAAQIHAISFRTLQAVNPELNDGRREVVFIDDGIADYQTLVDGMRAGVEVVLLDSSGDGLSAMAQWAASHDGYAAIHVISHGAEGQVSLGNLSLDAATANARAADLSTLGAALTEEGDLLLYGCNVASGNGQALLAALADHTGADVAASTNSTGASALGGDWLLEARTGGIEAGMAGKASFDGFHHLLLNVLVDTETDGGADATIDSDLATDETDGGGLSLREALNYTGGGAITFHSGLSGRTISLGSDLSVGAGTTFFTDPAVSLTITGHTWNLAGDMNVTTGTGGLLTIESTISGAGTLNKSGDGTLTLGNISLANSLANLNILAGTVISDYGRGTSSTTVVSIASGAALNFIGDTSVGSISGAGTIDIGANWIYVTQSTDTNFSGAITGTGKLFKDGIAVLTLSGTNNTASWETQINAGTLSIAGSSNLASGAVTLAGGTTLQVTGATTLANSVTLTGNASIDNSANVELSGTLSGAAQTLTKTGAGKLTLSGNNTLADITVSAGTLSITSDNNLGTGTLTLDGSTLDNNVSSFSTDNAIVLGGGGGTINVSGAAQTVTVTGIVSGSGALTKTNGGTLVLSGDNSYSGGTTIRGTNGVSITGSSAGEMNLGTGAVAVAGGSILTITGSGTTVSNNITLEDDSNSGTTATIANANSVTLSGVLGGAETLTKAGAGTLTLSGTNTHTGAVTVAAGTLRLSGGAAIGDASAVTVDSGATLSLAVGAETIGSLTGAGAVSLSYKLTTGGDNTSTTFSGVISSTNTSGLTKTGTGTLTLSGVNTYTGTTTVSAGELWLTNGAGTTLADTGAVIVSTGATLKTYYNETVGSIAGAGTININNGILTVGGNDTSTTFSGVIGQVVSGGLTKTGTGTLTLSGSNTYTGLTTVSAGSLNLSGGSALVDTAALTLAGTATLSLSGSETIGTLTGASGSTISLGANTLTVNQGAITLFDGIIGGSGGLTKTGSSELTLTGANTYTGATTVAAGQLTLDGSDVIADTSAVTVAAGATLFVSFNEAVGSIAGAGSINLNNGVLTVGGDNSSTAFSGVITDGTLVKTGTGTLRLDNLANTALVTVNAGTLGGNGKVGDLSVASGATLAPGSSAGDLDTGNLSLGSGAILDIQLGGTTAGTQYDQIKVTGSVNVTGATLNVSSINAFTSAVGDSFILIANDAADAVTGTFAGKAEGASFTVGSSTYKISYAGGDGNDVVLTNVTAPAPTPAPAPEPDPAPVPTPTPTPADDGDNVSTPTENLVPALPPTSGGAAVAGDGNGDGVADSAQANVTSLPFLQTDHISQNPNAPSTFVTLVAGSNAGQATSTAHLTSIAQQDRPADLPAEFASPLGQISFKATTPTAGATETFSLFVDASLVINGYWKQDASGTWVNLASQITPVGDKLRIDFAIQDGGQFDADGKADGIITDPGALAYVPLSITGHAPDVPVDGFWF